jgi:hypothetical protein
MQGFDLKTLVALAMASASLAFVWSIISRAIVATAL